MLVRTVNRIKEATEKQEEAAPEAPKGPSELDILIEIRDSLKK
jgi:large conductance mechanosensitive channel